MFFLTDVGTAVYRTLSFIRVVAHILMFIDMVIVIALGGRGFTNTMYLSSCDVSMSSLEGYNTITKSELNFEHFSHNPKQ